MDYLIKMPLIYKFQLFLIIFAEIFGPVVQWIEWKFPKL